MEAVGAVASMAQCLCGQFCSNESISQQCIYLRKPQSIVDEFEDKIKLLTAREADLRLKLQEEYILHGMNPTAEVNLWLSNVETMKDDAVTCDGEIKKNKRWLCGFIPNYHHRLKLGNRVMNKMDKVNQLLEQIIFSEKLLVIMQQPERGRTMPSSVLVGKRPHEILQRIWGSVMDDDIHVIGVYGMGGVGKTSIVKEIHNMCLRDNAYFNNVIWVTASNSSNKHKVQEDIAKEIQLSFKNGDGETARASKLFEALRRRRRFLLIIDDLWDAFSLENIGIPNAHDGKLLITTRSLNVCRQMETGVDIEVDVLSEEESWDLFKQKVGAGVLSSSRIQDLAQSVTKECQGLPLALITVGHALRNENNIEHWKAALSELNKATSSREGIQVEVFARLRFSYDRLKDDTARACFLYCALYPEDHLIDTQELIKYWVWEGLLGSSGSLLVKKQLGVMILNELKSACMIESVYQDGSPNEYVKMHDLIRDMAIALTSSTFMIKSGQYLRNAPGDNDWAPELERVSLMRNDLGGLGGTPRCPNLSTLLLQYNSIIKGIIPTFFENMQNLKLLDLSYTGIEFLPKSVSNLESLHTLLLRSCWKLLFIPTLAKLKELRVLDLSYSSITSLPEGMAMLVKLQHLDLSFINVSDDPFHLLPNYRFLESLFLIGSQQFGLTPARTKDLEECSRLEVLEANFISVEDFNHYIRSNKWSLLQNFRFIVGHLPSSINTGENSVVISHEHIGERLSPTWLIDVRELEMSFCSGITYLPFSQKNDSCQAQLQCCRIKCCHEMESVIIPESGGFPNLELLQIERLTNLSQLCRGSPAPGSLSSLKILHVKSCNNLKTLLPLELVPDLRSLVELRIEDCERISEVISEGEIKQEIHSDIIFPSLRILKLSSLPHLKQIYRGVMICDSLSSLDVFGCQNLKTIPFFKKITPQLVHSLKQIKGSEKWWGTVRENHGSDTNYLLHAFEEFPATVPKKLRLI